MWFAVAVVVGVVAGFAQLLKEATPLRGILIALPALLSVTAVAMFPRTDLGLRASLGVMMAGAAVSFWAGAAAWVGGWVVLRARGQRRGPFKGLHVLFPPSLTLVLYVGALLARGLLR